MQPQFYVVDKNPLYLVDGKEISKDDLVTIDPNWIKSVYVWKGQQAIDRFGDKGKNGVVETIMKKDYLSIPKTKYTDDPKVRPSAIFVQDPIDEKTIAAAKAAAKASGRTLSHQDKDQVIILDGEEVPYSKIDSVSPESIESVNVLKGEMAVEKYGDKGKDGVIEIKTKSKWKVGVGLNTFNPKSTALEYYQQMEKSAPSDSPFPDIDKSLILINGVPSSKNDLKSITADQIKMLYPTRAGDEEAIKKYGEQAKNGVIEIVTQQE